MAKVTVQRATPVQPPITSVILELSVSEARQLRADMLGRAVNQAYYYNLHRFYNDLSVVDDE